MPIKKDLSVVREMRNSWWDINEEAMPEAERAVFLKRKQAVDLYIDGAALKMIVLGNYFGDKKYTLEQHMNVRTLHKKFLCKCQELGIQNYEYPFTTRSKGYTALNRYINEKKKEKIDLAIRRESKDAQQKFNSTGFGTSTSLIPINPYSLVQIDGHKIDMLYTVEVEDIHGEIQYMPATRMWVIAVIDVATRAILGYSVTAEEMDFGAVATPESRGIVERFFKTMEEQCFHRLPGTTGSNVRDVRRHDPEKESVKYKITYNDIIELLEVFIATYNNTPHSSLENQSPLQVLKSKVECAGLKPYVLAPLERKKAEKLR